MTAPRVCSCGHSAFFHPSWASAPVYTKYGWKTVQIANDNGPCRREGCGCQGFAFPLQCPTSVWNAINPDRHMACWRMDKGGCRDCERMNERRGELL